MSAKEVIGRQVAHLARLVDDLLEITRISRGKIQLRRTRLDLAELARRTGEDHRVLFVRVPRMAPSDSDASASVHHHAGPMGRLRVLVVEDNVDAAESLAEVVKMLGHDVTVAYDGPTAIEKATSAAPDLVFCDIGLPGMTGYDVARALGANPRFSTIRLVAVTGYAQPEDVQRAVEAGFVEHIAKPPDPTTLQRVLSGRTLMPSA